MKQKSQVAVACGESYVSTKMQQENREQGIMTR